MAKTAIRIGCPKHGLLHSPVEYASFKVGKYDITDVPCVFCKECACYYSTSMSLTILTHPEMKGRELRKGISVRVSKDQKEPIRRAKVQENGESKSVDSSAKQEPKQKQRKKKEKKEYEGVTITEAQINLCNKSLFTNNQSCPVCGNQVKHKNVRIQSSERYSRGYRYFFTKKLYYCTECDHFLVAPDVLEQLAKKTQSILCESLWPANIMDIVERNGTKHYLPKAVFNEEREYLRGKHDPFYDMSPEEYYCAAHYNKYYGFCDDDYSDNIPFKSQSILGERRYSVNLSPAFRRNILRDCVDAYGKSRVITQINFNIRMREAQKDKAKYAHAIGVWQADIEFVETLEDTWAIRQEEEAKRRREEFEESFRRYQEERAQQRKEEKREWAWWEHRE